MPKGDYTEIVVLCEDRQSAVFARVFLTEYIGVNDRRIRFIIKPEGAGEQAVREAYAREVRAYRRYSKSKHIALVAMIDADTGDVDNRLKQLAKALNDAGEKPRADGERIALIVSNRNIETWIYYLRGDPVDEDTKYQKLKSEGDCKTDVKKLAADCRNNRPLSDDAPPSLQRSCDEIQRIR